MEVNGNKIDNSWVVPYNPLLLKIFNAHINVEYCNSVKSIKYICKYVHKGSDMAAFNISDEVESFRDGRYISSNEAFYRIFRFQIHDRYPSVLKLAVHLENDMLVYYNPDNLEAYLENEPPPADPQPGPSTRDGPPPHKRRKITKPTSTLLQFFELCKNDEFARTLLYMNVGMHYTWKDKKFTRRKNNLYSIGRVYTVHPKDIEKFYLRLLLHKIPGPTCYEDLRTVNGRLCETFQEACQELGLLECDNHWDMALTEATETAVPRKIRDLFAIILTFGIPSAPKDLWIKHRDSMSEDYLQLICQTKSHNPGPSTSSSQDELNEALDKQKAINMALIYIEDKC